MRTIQKQSEAAVGYEEQTKALEKERAEELPSKKLDIQQDFKISHCTSIISALEQEISIKQKEYAASVIQSNYHAHSLKKLHFKSEVAPEKQVHYKGLLEQHNELCQAESLLKEKIKNLVTEEKWEEVRELSRLLESKKQEIAHLEPEIAVIAGEIKIKEQERERKHLSISNIFFSATQTKEKLYFELLDLSLDKKEVEAELGQYVYHFFRENKMQQKTNPICAGEKAELMVEIGSSSQMALKNSPGLTPQQIQLQNKLTKACYNADIETVKELIEQKGADPARADEKGQYPLGAAIQGMAIEVFDYLVSLIKPSPDDYTKMLQHLIDTSGYTIPDIPNITTYEDWLQHFTSKKDRWIYNENQLNRRGYGFNGQYVRLESIPGSNEIGFLYANREKNGKRKFKGIFTERSFKKGLKGQMPFLIELYKAMYERLEPYYFLLDNMSDFLLESPEYLDNAKKEGDKPICSPSQEEPNGTSNPALLSETIIVDASSSPKISEIEQPEATYSQPNMINIERQKIRLQGFNPRQKAKQLACLAIAEIDVLPLANFKEILSIFKKDELSHLLTKPIKFKKKKMALLEHFRTNGPAERYQYLCEILGYNREIDAVAIPEESKQLFLSDQNAEKHEPIYPESQKILGSAPGPLLSRSIADNISSPSETKSTGLSEGIVPKRNIIDVEKHKQRLKSVISARKKAKQLSRFATFEADALPLSAFKEILSIFEEDELSRLLKQTFGSKKKKKVLIEHFRTNGPDERYQYLHEVLNRNREMEVTMLKENNPLEISDITEESCINSVIQEAVNGSGKDPGLSVSQRIDDKIMRELEFQKKENEKLREEVLDLKDQNEQLLFELQKLQQCPKFSSEVEDWEEHLSSSIPSKKEPLSHFFHRHDSSSASSSTPSRTGANSKEFSHLKTGIGYASSP